MSIPITTWVALHHGARRIEIRTILENTAQDHRLRVHFPAPFQCQSAWHDGHFEIVHRPVGVPDFDDRWAEHPRPEVPQRCFTSICNHQIGLIIANRGLPEVEVLNTPQGNTEVALTLLRCVGWLSRNDFSTRKGHAGPMLATPGAQEPGLHTYEYAVIPFDAQTGALPPHHIARAFCAPLRAVATGLHPGTVPAAHSMVSMHLAPSAPEEQRSPIVFSAIKPAENSSAWVIRVYNTSAETQTTAFTPWRPFDQVWKCNLAEQPTEQLDVNETGQIVVSLRGHEILTILLQDQSG